MFAIPVPPLFAGSVPVTPVPKGNPVALVSTAAEGVPRSGVVSVGEACITNVDPVPVCAATAVVLPTLVIGPPRFALVVTLLAVNAVAVPVMFVPTSALGVPRLGLERIGLTANTAAPEPVSSVKAAARFADDGVPRKVAIPVPNDVIPVPPFATASVPASVIAPTVAEDGVRPVVPAEKLLTNAPAFAEFVIKRVPS